MVGIFRVPNPQIIIQQEHIRQMVLEAGLSFCSRLPHRKFSTSQELNLTSDTME